MIKQRMRIYSVTLKNETDKADNIKVCRHWTIGQESEQWEKRNKRDEPYDSSSWCLKRVLRCVCREEKPNAGKEFS